MAQLHLEDPVGVVLQTEGVILLRHLPHPLRRIQDLQCLANRILRYKIVHLDYVEALLWPHGPNCPHCGNVDTDKIGRLNVRTKPSMKNPEGLPRIGLRKCYACLKTFTVRVGTIFEDSHLPMHLWLQVIHLMMSSKKGISTNQVQRLLRCSMKTAWFLTHRIREIMKPGSATSVPPLGEGAMPVPGVFTGTMGSSPARAPRSVRMIL